MFLVYAALIIILAKLVSALCIRYRQPPVLGMLLLGLLLGPTALRIIPQNEMIGWLAEIGVLILLFMAGLETELSFIRREGKLSILSAIGGVILPFFLGLGLCSLFHRPLTQALILATILTATSVSITVMTLYGLGRLRGVEGRTILNAAIIDDIAAVVILTLVFGLSGSGTSLGQALGKMALFFLILGVLGYFFSKHLLYFSEKLKVPQATLAFAFGAIFLSSYFAKIMGVAPITAAYLCGLFLGRSSIVLRRRLLEGMDTIGQAFFIPFFFVYIGLGTNLLAIHGGYLFLTAFVLVAILGKALGSGLGSKFAGLTWLSATRVGAGMVPRGEIALAVASLGVSQGLIGEMEFSATVVMVIATAIIAPILLKLAYAKQDSV